jgi:hypothetical protein
MTLDEITGQRDLTFSRWHRNLPTDCTWIDIDCCHYCHYCHTPLALFELVRVDCGLSMVDACRRKVASITHRVGVRLGVPVYKIAYVPKEPEGIQAAAIMRVGHPEIKKVTAEGLATFVNAVHDCQWCHAHSGGRFQMK